MSKYCFVYFGFFLNNSKSQFIIQQSLKNAGGKAFVLTPKMCGKIEGSDEYLFLRDWSDTAKLGRLIPSPVFTVESQVSKQKKPTHFPLPPGSIKESVL